jgi:hypothetical protein
MGRFERQGFDDARRTDVHINGRLTILPARPHFITRLRPGQQNETAWKQLPPILGANKFSRLKESNTQVLAQTAGGDPILVAGQYVAGRVLALAVDSTSPWYRYGFHTEHKRFWRQAILWLARKDDALGDGVWAKLDQRRLYRGERIAFTAGATGADTQPLTDVVLEAKVVGPQGGDAGVISPDGQQGRTLEPMATPGDLLEAVGRRDGRMCITELIVLIGT